MNILSNLIRLRSIDIDQRLKYSKNVVAIFFVAGMLCSFPVWITDRFFPIAPVFEEIQLNNFSLDITLLGILIIFLLGNVLFDKSILLHIALVSLVVILLQDQLRWQPWVYIYSLMLLSFAFGGLPKFQPSLLSCLQLIIAGVYVWSGVQKLNPNFIDNTFRDILTDLFEIKNQTLIQNIKYLGYSIPLVEIFIGVALMFPRLRSTGIIFCVATHIFILIYLSPLGISSNSVVYPWNIAMIILVFLLFFNVRNRVILWRHEYLRMKALIIVTVILIWAMPLFNLIDSWDNYLSFSLYSDKPDHYFIAIEEHQLSKIDKRFSKYFVNIEGLSGGEIIDVNKWSMDVLNVPFYPERRVFKKICKSFCGLGIEADKLIFLEIEQPVKRGRLVKFNCNEL